jgi:type I restriction enzyme M protein
MQKQSNSNGSNRKFTTQASLDSYVWSICNILRRSNCAGALQYVPELTWILFLRILDDNEIQEAEAAEAVGGEFMPSLELPYRWQDWAAPDGWKRKELANGALGAFFGFVNGELLPYLKGLRDRPNAGPRQKVISEILSGVEHVRVDTEKNFLDVLDKVHEIRHENIDTTHIFACPKSTKDCCSRWGRRATTADSSSPRAKSSASWSAPWTRNRVSPSTTLAAVRHEALSNNA